MPKPSAFNRALPSAAALPAALLFVPLIVPLVTGRVFAHMDLGVFHLPLRRIYADALAGGHSTLWSPLPFHGFYVHAEGQVGALHPLHVLLYRLLPLTTAFNLEVLLAYPFAFAGMWLFLRGMGLQGPSRTVGAMAFTFSGFFLLHLGHMNAIAVSAHVPWLLLAVDASLSDSAHRRARGAVAIAALAGSQVLLGYPQYVWLSALIVVLFGLTRAADRSCRRRMWLPAAAAAVGLMIGGIQLLPTLDLFSHSFRSAPTREFQLSFSLHPLNILQLWAPYVLPSRTYAPIEAELYIHEFGVYNGAFCTLAVAWAFARGRGLPARGAACFAGLLCVVGIVLALGRYGVFYEWLAELPVLGSFRAAARHVLLVQVGLAILAAVAFEDLVRSIPARAHSLRGTRWVAMPLVVSLVTAGGALLWWWRNLHAAPLTYPAAVMVSVGLMFVATTLFRDATRGVSAAVLVIPTFLALDLGFWGYSYAWGTPPVTVAQIEELAVGPPSAMPASVHDDAEDPSINYWLLRNVRVLSPYVGLYPSKRLPVMSEQTLRLAGVDWVKTRSGWRSVEAPMPRARVVPEILVSAHPELHLDHIDISRTAILDKPIGEDLAELEDVSIEIVVDEPGRLVLEIASAKSALLALTESYHSGWRATVDGRSVATVPIYGDFLGVVLAPGRYRLLLAFAPESFRRGAYLTLAGIVCAGILALTQVSGARRSGGAAGSSG